MYHFQINTQFPNNHTSFIMKKMYDKIVKFVEAMIEFFLHPLNKELFSFSLKLYHEIKKRKGDTIYAEGSVSFLEDVLYQFAGQTIPQTDINKLITTIDKSALDKWSAHIFE